MERWLARKGRGQETFLCLPTFTLSGSFDCYFMFTLHTGLPIWKGERFLCTAEGSIGIHQNERGNLFTLSPCISEWMGERTCIIHVFIPKEIFISPAVLFSKACHFSNSTTRSDRVHKDISLATMNLICKLPNPKLERYLESLQLSFKSSWKKWQR